MWETISSHTVMRLWLVTNLLYFITPSYCDHDWVKDDNNCNRTSTSSTGWLFVFVKCKRQHLIYSAYLVWLLLPAGQCVEPGTSPHRTAPRSWPPPPTAGMMCSMTRCHTLRGHVSDRAHRICWTIERIRQKEIDKAL